MIKKLTLAALLSTPLLLATSAWGQLPHEIAPDFEVQKGQNPRMSQLQDALPVYVQVFGLFIHSTASGVEAEKLLHAARIAADYLDNDRDGRADNPEVNERLWQVRAGIVMVKDDRAMEQLFDRHGEIFDAYRLQDLYASETHPRGAPHAAGSDQFDAALEEILHIITSAGYARVYPKILGESRGSQLADAMDTARGGYFRNVPRSYPPGAWYTYDDRTCDYSCQVTEYIYWALTSLLGGQDFPGRREEINGEWKLNTPEALMAEDRAALKLLTNPAYHLPTRLPDGNYRLQARDSAINPAVDTDGGRLVFRFTIPVPAPAGILYEVVASDAPGGESQTLTRIVTGDTLSFSGPAPTRQEVLPGRDIRVAVKDIQAIADSRRRFI
ncbi:MAG: hypothetical protein VCA55_00775 [Verrucomicrobiales bacterium]